MLSAAWRLRCSTVLLVVRTSFDAAGRVVEYDQEYWRHDAIRIHVDLNVRP
jgi:DNA-binding GntR family transcriptional regulator